MLDRKMPASVFRDISEQLSEYEQHGYDMEPIHTLPDTYCMGWRITPAALDFSCRLSYEVATSSMREQLSFDHALHHLQSSSLNVSGTSMKHIAHPNSGNCFKG